MKRLASQHDIPNDFTPQISALKLEDPCTSGSFGAVYRRTIDTSEGTKEVAVKVFKIDPGRAVEKYEKAMHRELKVWIRLSKHQTIVPLLGTAHVGSPCPALVSQWMPSGTLYMYLEQATITASNKVELIRGVADGLRYLHSENVVHGDLHPANVLIDGAGNPRLTDFGLATVVGDAELQLNTTTANHSFNPRWRAPEVIGIGSGDDQAVQPNFKSDVYSFGGVMFFIVSGDIPWKEKKNSTHIIIELLKRATPARPDNFLDDHWNLIQKCWSWNPDDRPEATEIIRFFVSVALAEDLTGQIFGTINDLVASGAFGNVYRCEWRRPSGPVKVAVKTFRHPPNCISEQDLRRFRRETAIWAHLIHDNIVTLYGTTECFGPTTALVSQWFPDGTLFRLITEQGSTLTTKSKLKLLHDIASGLYYLHSFPVVHGDVNSSNILVEIKDGEHKACLTDFSLSNVPYGHLKGQQIEGSTVRPGAIRWAAPELLRSHDPAFDIKPTTQNDMYSFGCIMYHLLTLTVPWHDINEYKVVRKIQKGEDIPRPEVSETSSDVTDTRWNHIEQCWSIDPSARPCALAAMNFITGELEVLKQDFPQSSKPSQIMSSLTFRTPATASMQVPFGLTPLHVLLFGETGAGKSAIINLIMGRDVAQASPDSEISNLEHTSYEVALGDRRFKLWEVSSLESMSSFRTFLAKRRLKQAYEKLYKDDGVYLLLYCLRGSRAQRALIRDYKFFTDIVGSTATAAGGVPVAAVVTSLEDYPMDMDKWWVKNKDNLESLGMRFSAHACITSLPDDPYASPAMRARRQRSEEVIRRLIHDSYQPRTETPRSSSPALTL